MPVETPVTTTAGEGFLTVDALFIGNRFHEKLQV